MATTSTGVGADWSSDASSLSHIFISTSSSGDACYLGIMTNDCKHTSGIFSTFEYQKNTVWGSENDNFYNIGKRRQICFNILPAVYGSEFDDFYLCLKNCHFRFPILYFYSSKVSHLGLT